MNEMLKEWNQGSIVKWMNAEEMKNDECWRSKTVKVKEKKMI